MKNENAANGVISFREYRVFKMDYNCEPGFNPKVREEGKLRFSFAYGSADLPNGIVQVNFLVDIISAEEDSDPEHAPFRVSVEMGGKFSMADGSEWNHRYDANAIAILYPYARALVSSVSAQTGIDPIILPTINVAATLAHAKDVKADEE